MKQICFSILVVILGVVFSTNPIQAQTETKAATIQIVDAKLGTDVKDRTIVDENTTFPLNSKVFVWLKIAGAVSETITVKWANGDLTHETQLSIGGSPWRTWANKTVAKTGDWTVTVTDGSGNVLKELTFKVQ
jgi:hypothetical protein